MHTLSDLWFMEGYVDYELQKYRLLAYLQDVQKHFSQTKLYPQLSDVIFHYNNLIAFRDNKKLMQDNFPKKLSAIDLKRLTLTYSEILQDDELMGQLGAITDFAVQNMKGTIANGTEIYELIEQQLRMEPVGIVPLYKDEGYMFLRTGGYNDVTVYNYTITLFEEQHAKYRGLKMTYVDTWQKSVTTTYEYIKRDVIKTINTLPNPAVYFIESELKLPLNETLLPIAKRVLIRYIAQEQI